MTSLIAAVGENIYQIIIVKTFFAKNAKKISVSASQVGVYCFTHSSFIILVSLVRGLLVGHIATNDCLFCLANRTKSKQPLSIISNDK